ncbi:MAG: glycosyltransferase family 9 protein [Candidatus Caenarcaniphilales bacterium]|nr:glycosyltransferase family 9 protein [Candidatus Caenarcaniphilales bacterium]
MKTVTINDEVFQQLNSSEFTLDLQTSQINGHRPFPYWNAKYLIPKDQMVVIPEGIYACLTGQQSGVIGSQYDLRGLFVEKKSFKKLPQLLSGFPCPESLKGKKILCVLAHNSFGLGDLILAMPFLKIFAEALKVNLDVSVNSAGVSFFHGQDWMGKALPEIISLEKFCEYDYYFEPSIDKMDSLGWIRSYLLKEIGESVFYRRFPSPELKVVAGYNEAFQQALSRLPKRDSSLKLCVLNWETSSLKRNLPIEIWKTVFKSLIIMGFQIVVSKPAFKNDGAFEWIKAQENVIDASPLILNPADLIYLVNSADLVVSPDTSYIHLAGGLRKRALCIFLKSANEIYKRAWLKGNYWPLKLDKLYPTVKRAILPNNSFKDMDAIIYQLVRDAAFNEDPEMIELYNSLFFTLKNQKMNNELERILKTKNVDLKKLEKANAKAEQLLEREITEAVS